MIMMNVKYVHIGDVEKCIVDIATGQTKGIDIGWVEVHVILEQDGPGCDLLEEFGREGGE